MAEHAPGVMTAAEAMARLIREDAIGQLRRREGTMARLGSEDGALKLDWVEMVPWLLAHDDALDLVTREAAALRKRGISHVIWSGMGGSVLTVRVLRALGYCSGPVTILPLDSTDPAALNSLSDDLAGAETVTMIAVAMGMTSEEPISHLEWLARANPKPKAGPPAGEMVIALPDSYLDHYARERGLPRVTPQLDGGSGTGGRMSAPGTRVFLTPVALYLAGAGHEAGALRGLLRIAWAAYDLDGARANPAGSRWVRLAVALAAAARAGAVRLAFDVPPGWETAREWTEQLMEESLGKNGKGVALFAPDALPGDAPATLRVKLAGSPGQNMAGSAGAFTLVEPLIASSVATERLAGLAAIFLGLQLTMALYGFLWDIPFAGQPAVETYKSRTRALRDSAGVNLGRAMFDATSLRDGRLALAIPPGGAFARSATSPASALADWLRGWPGVRDLPYLDLTINGEASADALVALEASLRRLAVGRLGMPYTLRRAPAAYHSTEQSEMDGSDGVISLRAVALHHPQVARADYSARFLEAQALATWQAMNEQSRPCFLALYDGDTAEMVAALRALLDAVDVELGAPDPVVGPKE